MNPHQAQMDYQMAMVNVGLSLVDGGVALKSVRDVLKTPGVVKVLSGLQQGVQNRFAKVFRLREAGKAEEAEIELQQLKGEVDEKTFKQFEELWQKLESAGSFGRIEVPRTPGLPKSMTLAELIKIMGVPGREGIILDQKSVSFADMWKLSNDTGLEYVLTQENGRYILRSGAPSRVGFPPGTRPIAHTHPLDPLGQYDPLPSRVDIDSLNKLWDQNPNSPRPTSTVIWGPEAGHTTQFGATGIDDLPKPNPRKRQ